MTENNPLPALEGLPELARRLSRKIEQGRGLQLSIDELDLLVAIGANELVQTKAAEYQRLKRKAIAAERAERQRSHRQGNSPETATEALERVQRVLRQAPPAGHTRRRP